MTFLALSKVFTQTLETLVGAVASAQPQSAYLVTELYVLQAIAGQRNARQDPEF